MIITVFSIALTIVCAVIAFKLGYTCGQTAERLDLLERFGEKREYGALDRRFGTPACPTVSAPRRPARDRRRGAANGKLAATLHGRYFYNIIRIWK